MKPTVDIPSDLRRLLIARSPRLLADVERFLADAPQRCTYVRSQRVADAPLRRSMMGRWLGRKVGAPVLGVLDSKFGGVPYAEEAGLAWERFSFLGQINFAQIEDPPPGSPRRGLFALDLASRSFKPGAFRVRWYAEPAEERARISKAPLCVGMWEARMVFSPGWSLPGGNAWHAPLPADDEELWHAWNDWAPEGFLEDERDAFHRLFGHRSAGLDEHYGFKPPVGRGSAIDEYQLLWRITFDNSAGFHWGTNWIYVLIHMNDLAESRLDRAVVTGANY